MQQIYKRIYHNKVALPKKFLNILCLKNQDRVKITVENNKIIIEKVKNNGN